MDRPPQEAQTRMQEPQSKSRVCPACGGAKTVTKPDGTKVTCYVCKGTGKSSGYTTK